MAHGNASAVGVSAVNGRQQWLALVWLFLFAWAFHAIGIGREPLWYDETWEAYLMRSGVDFFRAITTDTHPPLYHILLKIVVSLFGDSPGVLRALAAAGAGAIPVLMYGIVNSLDVPRKRALAVLASMAAIVWPALMYYGQDARMYTILSVFVLLSLLGALRKNYVVFALAGVAAIYTHNVALWYVGAIGLATLIAQKPRWRVMLALAVIATCYLPWLPIAVNQTRTLAAGWWAPAPSPMTVLWSIPLNSAGWRIPQGLQVPIYSAWLIWCAAGMLALPKMINRKQLIVLIAAFIGAPVGMLALSLTSIGSVWVYRAFLPSGLLLIIPCVFVLTRIKRYARDTLLIVLLVSCCSYWFVGARVSTAPIVSPVKAGARVWFLNATDAVEYTYTLPAVQNAIMPSAANLISLTQGTREAFGLRVQKPQSLKPGTWIIFSKSPFSDWYKLEIWRRLLVTGHVRLVAHTGGHLTDTYLVYYGE